MAKVTLNDINSGYNLSKINENFTTLENELNTKVLYRSDTGVEPNEWLDTQDANSNRLINLPDAISNQEPLTLGQYNAQATGTKSTATLRSLVTATAGQTVFTAPAYVVGSNNLSVYVNGVKQASDAYTETSTTSFTLTEGVEAGDKVEIYVNELQTSVDQVGATNVTYDGTTVGAYLDNLNFDTVAELIAAPNLRVGDVVYVAGYTTINDGGHGHYEIVGSGTGTDDGGSHIDLTGSPTCQAKAIFDYPVSVKRYGAKGDGSTDDSTAIKNCIEAGIEEVIVPKGAGAYMVDSAQSITLNSHVKLAGDGELKWGGSASAGTMFTVDCNGYDFEYDIASNGDNLISGGWLIESNLAMTADLPKVIFKGITKKFRATLATAFNSNAYIRGSYRLVQVSDGYHSETSRAASLSAATQTIVVDKKTGPLYPLTVKHFNNTYSGIASDDTGAADVDTDYFVCTLPDPTNFPNGDGTNGYPDVDVESYSNKYLNPIGRCEKFQCVPNTHDNVVIRDGDNSSRTMYGSSIDFNLQWGAGRCSNIDVYLKGDVTSPITTGYAPVSFFQGSDYSERRGEVTTKDVVVYNQIDSALTNTIDYLVGLQTNATSSAKPFSPVTIKDVQAVGGDVDHAVIMGYDTGGKGYISIENVEADFNYNPIAIQTACPEVFMRTVGIINLNATDRVMTNDVNGASRAFTGISTGHTYRGIERSYEFGATAGQTPEMSTALVDPLADQNSGGALSVQSKYMTDESTYTFGIRGFTKGNHVIIVNVSYGAATAQAMFACQGASAAIVEKTTPAATLFSLGTGSNPDTAGKVNLWVDANGALNAKNRLGSARAVTIMFLG